MKYCRFKTNELQHSASRKSKSMNLDVQNAIQYLRSKIGKNIGDLPKDQQKEYLYKLLTVKYGIQGANEIIKDHYAQIRHALFEIDKNQETWQNRK